MALQAEAIAKKSQDPAEWQNVRRWMCAAGISPRTSSIPKSGAADPLLRFVPGPRQPPSKNAADGMLYAAALAPFAPEARLMAARIYLQRGDAAKARSEMIPVAFSERGDYSTQVRTVMATLDQSGPDAALVAWDKFNAEAKAKAEPNGAG